MGFLNKFLRNMPGSPVSAAKTMLKHYNQFIAENPGNDKKDAFRYILQSRYKVLKTMKPHEIEQCLEFCDDLGEVVFWAIAKENPIAANQPLVRETVEDLYNYFITVAPEELSGLQDLMEEVSVGMEVNPFGEEPDKSHQEELNLGSIANMFDPGEEDPRNDYNLQSYISSGIDDIAKELGPNALDNTTITLDHDGLVRVFYMPTSFKPSKDIKAYFRLKDYGKIQSLKRSSGNRDDLSYITVDMAGRDILKILQDPKNEHNLEPLIKTKPEIIGQAIIDRAIELMKNQLFGEALHLLRRAVDEDPSQWNAWYMAGQCCRFLNDVDGAIEYLSRAAEIEREDPAIFLALGIAFQLNTQWDDAIEAFRRAIEIDSDYELAYNSLALTQKKRGEFDKALHNYDAGAMALARRIVKIMQNNRNSPILKHCETPETRWVKYAIYAAQYQASSAEGINSIAWPTGEQALEEERTERHAGLYWIDTPNDKEETVRLFLPNYFNTFRQLLKRDAAYSNLIGNRGTILELLDRHDEARLHFDEATEFLP